MLTRLLGDLCAPLSAPPAARRSRRRRVVPPVAALVELLESRELLSATPVIVDNSDAAFSNVRDWQDVAGGHNGTVSIASPNEAGALASWDFTGLENGQYYVQATWTAASDRATNALFTVRSSFGAKGREFRVNQRVAPAADFLSGATRFQTLGVITVREGKLLVELTNPGADGKVIADAVRLAPVAATDNSVAARTERLSAVALALFAYHEVHSQFPPTPVPALLDPNGKFLSWRVHLLPFLGYEDLYRQFHLNEPWDSPNNLPLVSQMPDVFRSRDLATGVGVTGFQRADFPGGFHITGAGGPNLRLFGYYGFGDGVSDNQATSLLLLETAASNAVPWTAADDTPFSPTDPLAFRGAAPTDFSLAAMMDGKVRQLSRDLSPVDLLALATWTGGEVLSAARVANIFVDPPATADSVSQTKLKQLMLGMHNYYDATGSLPAGRWESGDYNYDSTGNPYLSWRVHILPYIGEEALYKKFHIRERWDSPHNLALIDEMPEILRSTGIAPGSTLTGFQVFRGPTAYPLLGSRSGVNIGQLYDGFDNTIGIIEVPASSAQVWTRPEGDVLFDPLNPLAGLGAIPPQGWWVAMFDGTVRRVSPNVTAANLAAAVTWFGREVQGPAELANLYLDYPRAETIAVRREKLRQIGIAMHYYSWTYDAFPVSGSPDKFDANGQPLLSWRVHLLPYLGYSNLYEQFHLNEPWNSPHNLTLLDEMPDIFRTRDLPVGSNRTGVQLLTGPDAYHYTFFSGSFGRGPRVHDFRDGLSNTLLMVETQASQAVEWTRPDGDLTFDAANPLASLGWTGIENVPADGILVALADATVRAMRPTISAGNFAALATFAGDEVLTAVAENESFFDPRPFWDLGARNPASGLSVYDQFRRSLSAVKLLMLGMHNYEDIFNEFPVSRGDWRHFDTNGNPLLSWRVHILPWIDQDALYAQFRLHEPWDSPHNLPLLDQMPEIFRSRGLPVGTNLTGYQVVADPAAYNMHISTPRTVSRMTDGESNTISIIETPPELAVPWTKPEDFPFDPADPFAAIRALVTDYIVAGMMDGSVRAFHPQIAPADVAALITWRGDETSYYPGFDYNGPWARSLTPEIQITDSTGAKFQNETNIAAFGPPGGAPVDKTFTIKNTGSQTLTISAIDLPAGFSLVSTLTPIAPGATLVLTLRSAAGSLASGIVTIHSNVPHQTVTKFAVTGAALPLSPTVVTDVAGGTYNGSPFAATATAHGVGGVPLSGSFQLRYYAGTTPTGSYSNSPPFIPGVYTVVADFDSDNSAYANTAGNPVTFTIATLTPTVVVSHLGAVYNGNPQPATAVVTGSGGAPVSGATIINYYAGSTATGPATIVPPRNVGTYTAVATFTSSDPLHGNAVSNPVTFSITPAPLVFGITNSFVNDDQPAGTLVGTFHVVDPNVPSVPRTWTYAFVAGTGSTDNARFTLDAAGNLRTVGPVDYETKPNYTVRVRGTASDGLVFEQAFTITVLDFPEIVLSQNTIQENRPSGTLVGLLSLPNPVPGRTYTYSLVKGTGSTDNGSFSVSGTSLATKSVFDFEAKSSYTIRVRATESGTKRTVEQVLTISVLNVIEAPTAIALSSTSVAQNRPIGTIVGAFSALPAEVGSTYAFALVSGAGATDNARFTIDASGNLRTTAVFVYDKKSKGFSIRVRVTDNLGRFIEQILRITVSK